MKCINCGAEISDTDKFCGYCGTAVVVQQPIPLQPTPEPQP